MDCLEMKVVGEFGERRKSSQNFLHLSSVSEFGLVQFVL